MKEKAYVEEKSYMVTRMRRPLATRLFGGEGGIRTLDGLLTHTPLAGERLQPLGHLSGGRTLVPFLGRAPEIGIIAAQGR